MARSYAYWTESRILFALQVEAARLDRPPAYNEWRRAPRDGRHPTSATVQNVFGSWSAAVKAAGLEARPRYGQPPELCKAGKHLMAVEGYNRPGGGRQCRACVNERERRQRAARARREAAKRNQRGRAAERRAKRLAERREAGVCLKCGKHPAEPDRTCCAGCLGYLRETDARRRRAT
jgi:hypothetical protein